MTHLSRPATIRGLESSIRPQGVRRCASRFVVSGEHSKAPPTTPLARPKTSVTMPVSGCRRLNLASGSLITQPTWRTHLNYHRDHLKYVMGERAGHWNDVRTTYATPVTSPHRRASVSGRGSAPTAFRRTAGTDARLVGRGVAPAQSPSQLTQLGGTYKKMGVVCVNIERGWRSSPGLRTQTGSGKGLKSYLPRGTHGHAHTGWGLKSRER